MTAPVPAAAAVAAAPATAETPASQVTTTETKNRWPLYVAGAVVLLVLVALLVAHPWTDDTADEPTPGADTVRVKASAYIGEPVEDVEAALADKGLKTTTDTVDNSGDHEAGTVADLDPTGEVAQGATITLDVWGEAPKDEAPKDEGEKPEKTKAPKPDKTKAPPATPDTTETPDNTGTGNGTRQRERQRQRGGDTGGSPGPGERQTQQTNPSNGPKGD